MGHLFFPVVKKIAFNLQNSSKAFKAVLLKSIRPVSVLNSSLEKGESRSLVSGEAGSPSPCSRLAGANSVHLGQVYCPRYVRTQLRKCPCGWKSALSRLALELCY